MDVKSIAFQPSFFDALFDLSHNESNNVNAINDLYNETYPSHNHYEDQYLAFLD